MSENTTESESSYDEPKVEQASDELEAERVSDAPEAAESEPVTVEPAAAPGLLDQFEVTPERGHRKK